MPPNKWLFHPDSKNYSYCTNVISNGWHPLKDNTSDLVVGLVNQSCSKVLSPDDISFLYQNRLSFDPTSVDGSIYKFIVQLVNDNTSSPPYISHWFSTYDACFTAMTNYNLPTTSTVSKSVVDNHNKTLFSSHLPFNLNPRPFTFMVVGMRYRNNHSFSIGDTVTLKEEDNNIHDPNAIQVLVNNKHVAYVSREDAPKLRSIGFENKLCTCSDVFPRSARFILKHIHH